MSEIVRIPLEKLETGMVVMKLDKSGLSFPYYGRALPDVSMKDYLVKNGVQFAYIKSEESVVQPQSKNEFLKDYLDSVQVAQSRQNVSAKDSVVVAPTITEYKEALLVHAQAKQITKALLNDVRLGKVIDTGIAKNVVKGFVTHCIKSPEAFVNLSRLKDFDNYTFTHSVNVSILAIAIGKRLGLSAEAMNSLGLGGLLHDIGKMMVPEEILNKPGKLTPEEFEVIKLHPEYGYEYLRGYDFQSEVLQAVRFHHEKSDGSGYPFGLVEKDIPRNARIISITDVYDAVTSERVYHKGMMPSEALKLLFSWSGKHFNDTLVKFFISIMGIYPVGTLVALDTNELAIIYEPTKNEPMRPKVLLITDRNMIPREPTYFDLTRYNVATGAPYRSIVTALNPKDFSINTNEIIEKHLNIKKPDGDAVSGS